MRAPRRRGTPLRRADGWSLHQTKYFAGVPLRVVDVRLGHEQTLRNVGGMSVIPLKADIRQRIEHVCFVPTADVRRRPTDFRQVDPEWSSLPGRLHPLLLADCWQARQESAIHTTRVAPSSAKAWSDAL
jgi:hypothetical protein